MISRLRLQDYQVSGGPELVGLCGSDTARVARLVNRVQERLLTCREAGETGWYGGYAEVVFNVDTSDPYITLPRGSARLLGLTACKSPIPLQNQFYEYMEFGSGNWPKIATVCACSKGVTQGLRRNTVPMQGTLTTPGYGLRFYTGNDDDAGKRVLVNCLDANGQAVFTEDGTYNTRTRGVYVTLAAPFTDMTLPGASAPLEVSAVLGVQKDQTIAPVTCYEVDIATSTDMTLLLTMEPSEQVAAYTRYYLNHLPDGCCPVTGTTSTVQVSAMVKLDLVKALVSTDYLLIQSLEAIIAEAQAMRLGEMDSADTKGQAVERHRQAIGYLQGQLVHYEGKDNPAVNFAPFGTARLLNQRIGLMR
jgi:hypothetical protein